MWRRRHGGARVHSGGIDVVSASSIAELREPMGRGRVGTQARSASSPSEIVGSREGTNGNTNAYGHTIAQTNLTNIPTLQRTHTKNRNRGRHKLSSAQPRYN